MRTISLLNVGPATGAGAVGGITARCFDAAIVSNAAAAASAPILNCLFMATSHLPMTNRCGATRSREFRRRAPARRCGEAWSGDRRACARDRPASDEIVYTDA